MCTGIAVSRITYVLQFYASCAHTVQNVHRHEMRLLNLQQGCGKLLDLFLVTVQPHLTRRCKMHKKYTCAMLKGKNDYKSSSYHFCIKNLVGDSLLVIRESATCHITYAESIFDYEYLCKFDTKVAKAFNCVKDLSNRFIEKKLENLSHCHGPLIRDGNEQKQQNGTVRCNF